MNPPERGRAASLSVTLMSNLTDHTICGSVERQEFPSKRSFDTLAYCNTQLFVDRDNRFARDRAGLFRTSWERGLGSVALASAVVASEGRLGP